MRDLRIAAAQFEYRDADKVYNLARIRELTATAVSRGAEVVSFPECSISGYSFFQSLTRDELFGIAEAVPAGPSVDKLIDISREAAVPIFAGLLERDGDKLYNAYVCVDGERMLARFRKLHAFINPHISSGTEYCVFELLGCKVGILICYDCNLVENVRMTTLLGAEIVFMPHVTGCLPSVMPGRGTVDPQLWRNRERDPVRLRQELNGPKGRGWLMRWLPARAYDNGIYAVFTNPIGIDGEEVRNGNSMILDPFGEIIAECCELGDDVCVALCTAEKIPIASGRRYIRARRPELYGTMTESSGEPPVTLPGWTLKGQDPSE